MRGLITTRQDRTRAFAFSFLVVTLLLAAGCKHRASADDAPAELGPGLLSEFAMSEPRAAIQLTGFYPTEPDGWRWASGAFGLVLKVPEGAAQRGARLELGIVLPEAVFNQLGPVTLSADFDGSALEPVTFAEPEDYTYTREIAPEALQDESVYVQFRTDKVLSATPGQTREVVLVVTRAALLVAEAVPGVAEPIQPAP